MPRIFNSGLDSASPTAKASSKSSPISVSMMTICWVGAPTAIAGRTIAPTSGSNKTSRTTRRIRTLPNDRRARPLPCCIQWIKA
jgi:hypothetical protein